MPTIKERFIITIIKTLFLGRRMILTKSRPMADFLPTFFGMVYQPWLANHGFATAINNLFYHITSI